ncbi:hypothetical protein O7614_26595 [Micromonospora sp. WMMD961]|uniref:hypothetical protein n=1 Tax=Micromonospora sp. WMMD961 TaxID=3016100 RepID=UPI0024174921|nr:hypothetical protein [Micromonospora sp. WMMD961]MDG4783234.1 hypothetical protein [Micromonospora sp. WMMD961]
MPIRRNIAVADHALGRLIGARLADGDSYGDIAERGGDALSKSRVHQLANDPQPPMPKRDVMEALARSLGLPYRAILRAAEEAAGLADIHVYHDLTPDSDTEIIIAHREPLSPERRADVARRVEELLRELPDEAHDR